MPLLLVASSCSFSCLSEDIIERFSSYFFVPSTADGINSYFLASLNAVIRLSTSLICSSNAFISEYRSNSVTRILIASFFDSVPPRV